MLGYVFGYSIHIWVIKYNMIVYMYEMKRKSQYISNLDQETKCNSFM